MAAYTWLIWKLALQLSCLWARISPLHLKPCIYSSSNDWNMEKKERSKEVHLWPCEMVSYPLYLGAAASGIMAEGQDGCPQKNELPQEWPIGHHYHSGKLTGALWLRHTFCIRGSFCGYSGQPLKIIHRIHEWSCSDPEDRYFLHCSKTNSVTVSEMTISLPSYVVLQYCPPPNNFCT